MADNQKIEAKEYKAEDFAREYQALCEKMGYRIVVNPAFIARDDGSWSVVLKTSVEPLQKTLTNAKSDNTLK